MYNILPDPNINKKVKVISEHGSFKEHIGQIGTIAKIDGQYILVKFPKISAATHTSYNHFIWFDPDQLEEVED